MTSQTQRAAPLQICLLVLLIDLPPDSRLTWQLRLVRDYGAVFEEVFQVRSLCQAETGTAIVLVDQTQAHSKREQSHNQSSIRQCEHSISYAGLQHSRGRSLQGLALVSDSREERRTAHAYPHRAHKVKPEEKLQHQDKREV